MSEEYDSLTSPESEYFTSSDTQTIKKVVVRPPENTIALKKAVYTSASIKKKTYRVKIAEVQE